MKPPRSLLITGGTGSFGTVMMKQMLEAGVEDLRILSRDEEKQDALRNRIGDSRVRFYIGDIRTRESVDRAVAGVDCVFHAAALKQVPSCEFFPMEAIRTNVLGSENVIRASIDAGVKSVVCLSTDKAVFPVNTMGMSKAIMEKIAQSIARDIGRDAPTKISSVRYGNVMYSRGSVIPLFIQQIKAGNPITLTEPTMTRFLMPLRDSVALVNHAFTHAEQGDLFIKKAPAASLIHLVQALKELFEAPDHPVKIIGWRHAEKLYETLASSEELSTAVDMGEYYRIRLDHRDLNYSMYFTEGSTGQEAFDDFHSHNADQLSVEQIKELLLTLPEVRRDLGMAAEDAA